MEDSSITRSSIEAYLDYGENILSPKTTIICASECLKGAFIGNIDISNTQHGDGVYKLVIRVQAIMQDYFKISLISIGDLILKSRVFEENKGKIIQF